MTRLGNKELVDGMSGKRGISSEPSFRGASESDAGTLLSFMREYYAFDGHGFDVEKAQAALIGLLRDPNLGRAWLIEAASTADARSAALAPHTRSAVPVGYIVLCFGAIAWNGWAATRLSTSSTCARNTAGGVGGARPWRSWSARHNH
jgi:hypothetical protein